ncbi:MAG TPA: hypothetical protein ENH29_04305, partial [Bacteroidetes bacterium]|nr:hypothetical protein [Bacteroidota bacterium]
MQVTKKKLFMSLFVLLMLFSFSSVMADVLVISPESATVPVKGHVQFEVHLFSESAAIKPFPRTVTWQVLPAGLGKITDDGFFMAGDKPGRCVVVATMKAGGQAVRAEAKVQIGSVAAIAGHLPMLVIRPKEAALAFGDTLKFRAILHYPTSNKEIKNVMLNWTVKPRSLGKINQRGVFVAGNQMNYGKVIAYVEYMGKRIYDEAYVVVGTRPTSA